MMVVDVGVAATTVLAADVLNSLTTHIAVLDSRGVIVLVNDAWRRFAQNNGSLAANGYVGTNYLAVCEDAIRSSGDETARAVVDAIRSLIAGEKTSFSLEYPCHSPTEERWFILRATRLSLAGPPHIVVAHEDITARRRAEEDLLGAKQAIEAANRDLQQALQREQLLARTDPLTGTFNRRHFFDVAAHAFAEAKRYRHHLSVMLIDTDNFKTINDRFGHQVGDEILRAVAQCIGSQLRESDIVARYGGEEFIVLLPSSDARESAAVAERIRGTVAALGLQTERGAVAVTVSIGIAEVLPQEGTLDRFVKAADEALYKAKEAGRNCVVTLVPPV
jgi:diguanylate cyclase (GGDEF)-like protein